MISVLAEFERCGIAYEWAGESEVKCKCPFHDDESPSCHVNVKKSVFKCHAAGCRQQGDIVSLLARYLKTNRVTVLTDLSKRYDIEETKTIDPTAIEKWHSEIWSAKLLLRELRDRGVSDDAIRKHRLGVKTGRITIPIKSERGLFVNVRHYLPGAPGAEKMKNTRGYSKPRLFPIEQVKYQDIVLLGGEVKAIVAAEELNEHGIGAISTTNGEDAWDPSFNKYFDGKRVYVCMDIDDAGRRAAEMHCYRLSTIASWVGNLLLPLDPTKYPKGDVNDWIGQEKQKLFPLLESVEQYVASKRKQEDTEPVDIDVYRAADAAYCGQRIRLTATVSAMEPTPYVIPAKVRVLCDKSQSCCAMCDVYALTVPEVEISRESPAILDMIDSNRNAQAPALKLAVGVPKGCEICDFEPLEWANAEDIRMSAQLEITDRSAERVMQPAINVGRGLELNETYVFTGRMYPHPRTQQSVLVLSAAEPARDVLSNYVPVDLHELDVFKAGENGIAARLDDLYADLEYNVTQIYQRRDMHLVMDLAWHSPLLVPFQGKVVKGWVEVLVLGDSSQGKTETALGLMRHYGLGERVECKNASAAGLLGGLQQLGSRWFVTWGVIPTHDRRLVILEELKGASVEVISKLTDMRSSGIAEIPKIDRHKTHARTRLVALSNPRGDKPLAAYAYGVEAVKELIGGLEDVRRFDLFYLVSSRDIDTARLNTARELLPAVGPRYTADLCRRLVLWAWTRREDQVLFAEGATEATLREAQRLNERFTDQLPLVDRGGMRHKLARLAAALAARLFSTDETRESILVTEEHVAYVSKFIDDLYSGPVVGYRAYTEAVQTSAKISSPDEITSRVASLPFPREFVQHMLHMPNITVSDVQDWCGWERTDAQALVGFLVRQHALVKDSSGSYRKSEEFIQYLKTAEIPDVPAHLRERF